jgi:hypothetical protein
MKNIKFNHLLSAAAAAAIYAAIVSHSFYMLVL